MFIVTGATGQLGNAIAHRLVGEVGASEVAVSVRNASAAGDLVARGVDVRQADFELPDSLEPAFAGATCVLIVSGPSDSAPHREAIRAAKAAGARRIVYTSHQAASSDSLFPAAVQHAETERELAAVGVEFTALRNGFYASSAIQFMGNAMNDGTIAVPEDGRVSWTAHTDLAGAAVVALTDPSRLVGVTAPLTGPDALDFDDIARIASDVADREIRRVTVSDEEWMNTMRSLGVPNDQAVFLLGIFLASRNGEFNVVNPTLAELSASGATPFIDVLTAAATST